MASNYNAKQVNFMIEEYTANPNRETVDKLAETLNKSLKSIIGKLSREGVYQKAIYKTKTGEVPITKSEIINNIADVLVANGERLIGLEKAPKQELKYLYSIVKDKK